MLSFVGGTPTLKLLILAVLQGVTEILPVSSSGHLVVFERLLGSQQPLVLEVFLHLATLIAIILYFRREVIDIIKSPFVRDKNAELTLLSYIILGSIPATLVGFLLKDRITLLFDKPSLACLFLLITGIFVISTGLRKETRKELTVPLVLIIGIFQAIAILPGISRSGFTIGIALLLGVKKELAFKFSFLLAIPVILGANLLEIIQNSYGNFNLEYLIAGIVSFITAYFSILFLASIVRRGRLFYFGLYCLIAGPLFYLML